MVAGAADSEVGDLGGLAENAENRVFKPAYGRLLLDALAGVGSVKFGDGGVVYYCIFASSCVGVACRSVARCVDIKLLHEAYVLVLDDLCHGVAAHCRKLSCSSDIDLLRSFCGLDGGVLCGRAVLAVVHGVDLRQRQIGVEVEGVCLAGLTVDDDPYLRIELGRAAVLQCLPGQAVDIVNGVFRRVGRSVLAVVFKRIGLVADSDCDLILGVRGEDGIAVGHDGLAII